MASDESRVVGVKSSQPNLVEKSGLTSSPLVVAAEEDPFVIKLDPGDPTHPKVCVAPSVSPWLSRIV